MNLSAPSLLISIFTLLSSISPSNLDMEPQGEQVAPTELNTVAEWSEEPDINETNAPVVEDPEVYESFTDGERTASVDGAGGYTDEEIEEMQDWVQKTLDGAPPEKEIRPGEMWSDQIGLPANVSKKEADQAEIQIAQEANGETNAPQVSDDKAQFQSALVQTASYFGEPRMSLAQGLTNCQTFPFSSHKVCGAILQRYVKLGGATSWLLWPTEAMTLNPDGIGYRQRFVNGFIYWSPSTGAPQLEPMP